MPAVFAGRPNDNNANKTIKFANLRTLNFSSLRWVRNSFHSFTVSTSDSYEDAVANPGFVTAAVNVWRDDGSSSTVYSTACYKRLILTHGCHSLPIGSLQTHTLVMTLE